MKKIFSTLILVFIFASTVFAYTKQEVIDASIKDFQSNQQLQNLRKKFSDANNGKPKIAWSKDQQAEYDKALNNSLNQAYKAKEMQDTYNKNHPNDQVNDDGKWHRENGKWVKTGGWDKKPGENSTNTNTSNDNKNANVNTNTGSANKNTATSNSGNSIQKPSTNNNKTNNAGQGSNTKKPNKNTAAAAKDVGVGNIFTAFQNTLAGWTPTIKNICMWVFGALALIDLVWTFGMMALKGFEFGEFLSTLIKKIMMIGIFLWLFQMDFFIKIIINSFTKTANLVIKSQVITPESVVDIALNIGETMIDHAGITATGLTFLFASIVCLICILFMALDLILAYLKYYMLLPISFFALALGGLENFRTMAFNPLLTTLKIGVEIFLVTGLIGISTDFIHQLGKAIDAKATVTLALQAISVSFLCCLATKMVSSLVEAVFAGSIGDRANAGAGFRAVAAAAMGAAGTAAAVAKGGASAGLGVARTLKAAKALNQAEGTHTGLGSTLKTAGKAHFGEIKNNTLTSMGQKSNLHSAADSLNSKRDAVNSGNIGGGAGK